MDTASILAKLIGLALLLWTVYSIVKHVRAKVKTHHDTSQPHQSMIEQVLNNLLLYVWLLFMLVFSSGMIINN